MLTACPRLGLMRDAQRWQFWRGCRERQRGSTVKRARYAERWADVPVNDGSFVRRGADATVTGRVGVTESFSHGKLSVVTIRADVLSASGHLALGSDLGQGGGGSLSAPPLFLFRGVSYRTPYVRFSNHELRLLLASVQGGKGAHPRQRRAEPVLPAWDEITALAQDSHPYHVGRLLPLPRRGRIDR
jgi:hypothetical protein